MGLSSRVASLEMMGPTFWAEDAMAVMDAVGCKQATVFAPSFTAMTGAVLAADYPERVRSLVIVNGAARMLWAPDYRAGARVDLSAPFTTVAMEPDAVEQGVDVLKVVAPTVATDEAFRAWWDRAGIGRHHQAWRARSPTSWREPTCVIGSRGSWRRR